MSTETRKSSEILRLEGEVKDVSLQEIFRLLKISGKSGLLRVAHGKAWGR